jgi:ribosomal-protein-serine acetyltransferase
MSGLKVDDEIKLRLYRKSDAAELFAVVNPNFEHLKTFLHWVKPDYSLASAKEFIVQNQKSAAEKKSEAYGIFYQNKLAGSVGFVNFSWHSRFAEIGYWVAKDFEGRGIITKSCRALINYAFEDLAMNRIEIRCAVENIKSRAIPERLGFRLEGVLRQAVWRHTRFYDVAIYGLLAEEWRKQ